MVIIHYEERTAWRPRAEIPKIHAWVDRIRVLEYLLMKTHPDHDDSRGVIDSQERRARNTTRALIRSWDVSVTAAMSDVSWPPREGTTMVMERLPEIGDLLDTTGKFLGKTGDEEDEEAGEGVGAGVVDLLL